MKANAYTRTLMNAATSDSRRRAVIDIGSNTVRMVLYGAPQRAPGVLLNEKVTARLGRGLNKTGRMDPESIEIALTGLARFALILDDLGIRDVQTVATAAVREAENGPEFLEAVRKLGLRPRVLTGDEEAQYSALGVIGAFPDAQGVAVDLGGGSLELVSIDKGITGTGVSLPIGSLRIADLRREGDQKFRRRIAKEMKALAWDRPVDGALYMVGGSWRSLAVVAMDWQGHPLNDPHGLRLTGQEALNLAKEVARSDPDTLRKLPRVSSMRAAYLPDAGALLEALLEQLQPRYLVFSSWGLREGILYNRLGPIERRQDPLIAGISLFAGQHGASPTLATRVAGWTVGAVTPESRGSERLRTAATMLALAAMQIEPNLRLTQAVEWALYKRWLDLDDTGRGMLAAALYGNAGTTQLPPLLSELAASEALHEGLGWGLAVRLCRRFGANSLASLNASMIAIDGERLVFRVHEARAGLIGSPTRKDMKLLAEHLRAEPVIEVLDAKDFACERARQSGSEMDFAAE